MKSLFSINIRALILLGSMVILFQVPEQCIGIVGGCCPTITPNTKLDYPIICSADCPGGGRVHIDFEIEFKRGDEFCTPGNLDVLVRDETSGEEQKFSYKTTSTGIYNGTADVAVQSDTTYTLIARGGTEFCGETSKEFHVDVVEKGDYKDISIPAILDPPSMCSMTDYFSFGPGVLVDYVYNPYELKVTVGVGNSMAAIPPFCPDVSNTSCPLASTQVLHGEQADGNWTFGFDNDNCHAYADTHRKEYATRAYLQCNCP